MPEDNKNFQVYIIGGGIASLSTAIYLITDAKIKGESITIFDASDKVGGSLDAKNLQESDGYVMRGVRMFEEDAFACTFDLMSRIPSLTAPGKNLREEFIDFNRSNKTHSTTRLIRKHEPINSRPLLLKLGDKLKLIKLILRKEKSLGKLSIENYFSPEFFQSNFWYEVCTTFAFQPWHSLVEFRRYMVRFIQDFPYIDTLDTIEITPYNQYDSLIKPIETWLREKGVQFSTNTQVENLGFVANTDKHVVNRIYYKQNGEAKEIVVDKDDLVFATLGSLVANTSFGSMIKAPVENFQPKSVAWQFWENIARDRPDFGNPQVFNAYIDKSRWTSFTITFKDPTFFKLINKFLDKKINAFGGISLLDSPWFISMALTYRPYFANQPEGVNLTWGSALFSDKEGTFIKKKISECTGEEILKEIIHHLGFTEHIDKILKTSICIPGLTPFVTSQFLPRLPEDRPKVVPDNSHNLAFLGQFCEVPEDTVFTVDYSVRSAQLAVYNLLKLNKKPIPIYKGTHYAKVLFKAVRTMLR